MILLDTDTFSLHAFGHARVLERFRAAREVPAITIVTEIEVLRGRHEALLKAAHGEHLLRAQEGLVRSLQHLALFLVVPVNAAAAAEFNQLRQHKKLKKVGRADPFIASICLSNRATLITRNLKDFHRIPGLQVENWAD